MRISIVSIFANTTINSFGGQRHNLLSGIFSNILPLASMLDKESIIYPVCRVGSEDVEQVISALSIYENVETSGVIPNLSGSNESILTYTDKDHRISEFISRTKSLEYQDIKPYKDVDLILFNFAGELDASPDAVMKIRFNSKALIYIDIHDQVYEIDSDGVRQPKHWEAWKTWLSHADIVQANKEECSLTIGRELSGEADYIAAGLEIISVGPTQVLVTLGDAGTLVVYREDNVNYSVIIEATSHKAVDTTGCGDAFSAGYITCILENEHPILATAFGNTLAGFTCEFLGYPKKIHNKEMVYERMLQEYPGIENLRGKRIA